MHRTRGCTSCRSARWAYACFGGAVTRGCALAALGSIAAPWARLHGGPIRGPSLDVRARADLPTPCHATATHTPRAGTETECTPLAQMADFINSSEWPRCTVDQCRVIIVPKTGSPRYSFPGTVQFKRNLSFRRTAPTVFPRV